MNTIANVVEVITSILFQIAELGSIHRGRTYLYLDSEGSECLGDFAVEYNLFMSAVREHGLRNIARKSRNPELIEMCIDINKASQIAATLIDQGLTITDFEDFSLKNLSGFIETVRRDLVRYLIQRRLIWAKREIQGFNEYENHSSIVTADRKSDVTGVEIVGGVVDTFMVRRENMSLLKLLVPLSVEYLETNFSDLLEFRHDSAYYSSTHDCCRSKVGIWLRPTEEEEGRHLCDFTVDSPDHPDAAEYFAAYLFKLRNNREAQRLGFKYIFKRLEAMRRLGMIDEIQCALRKCLNGAKSIQDLEKGNLIFPKVSAKEIAEIDFEFGLIRGVAEEVGVDLTELDQARDEIQAELETARSFRSVKTSAACWKITATGRIVQSSEIYFLNATARRSDQFVGQRLVRQGDFIAECVSGVWNVQNPVNGLTAEQQKKITEFAVEQGVDHSLFENNADSYVVLCEEVRRIVTDYFSTNFSSLIERIFETPGASLLVELANPAGITIQHDSSTLGNLPEEFRKREESKRVGGFSKVLGTLSNGKLVRAKSHLKDGKIRLAILLVDPK